MPIARGSELAWRTVPTVAIVVVASSRHTTWRTTHGMNRVPCSVRRVKLAVLGRMRHTPCSSSMRRTIRSSSADAIFSLVCERASSDGTMIAGGSYRVTTQATRCFPRQPVGAVLGGLSHRSIQSAAAAAHVAETCGNLRKLADGNLRELAETCRNFRARRAGRSAAVSAVPVQMWPGSVSAHAAPALIRAFTFFERPPIAHSPAAEKTVSLSVLPLPSCSTSLGDIRTVMVRDGVEPPRDDDASGVPARVVSALALVLPPTHSTQSTFLGLSGSRCVPCADVAASWGHGHHKGRVRARARAGACACVHERACESERAWIRAAVHTSEYKMRSGRQWHACAAVHSVAWDEPQWPAYLRAAARVVRARAVALPAVEHVVAAFEAAVARVRRAREHRRVLVRVGDLRASVAARHGSALCMSCRARALNASRR